MSVNDEEHRSNAVLSSDSFLETYAPILKNLIRYSSAINAKDIAFYNSIDSDIKSSSTQINSSIVTLMNDLLKNTISVSTDSDLDSYKFNDDFETENNQILSNVLDVLLEKVELNLDNHYKFKKNKNYIKHIPIEEDDGYSYLDKNDQLGDLPKADPYLKPQDSFETKIDNYEITPFKPLLKFKPNAVEPFEESLKMVEKTDDIPEHYKNPYSYEILNSEYPEWILEKQPEFTSVPWDESKPAQWIDNPQQLADLIVELNACKIIAIDLEHHDYRTYHGLTSLMQITTDSKNDYLIDPLSPSLRENLVDLNVVFTNPNIVKVLHGAFMDVIWLQRDLGLYLVSLFDTFHAAKQLHLGKYSLAYLLEEYSKFKTSKKWQLADWRIRPLSKEMMNYAKADTHFLIEIFYKMHSQLLDIPNALQKALFNSRKVALRRFEYSTYKPKNLSLNSTSEVVVTNNSVSRDLSSLKVDDLTFNYYSKEYPWTNLIFSNSIPLENRPLVEILFRWRDEMARANDESARYIMSDFILVSLATSFDVKLTDVSDVTNEKVLKVVHNTNKFGNSFFIKRNIDALTSLIQTAVTDLKNIDLEKIESLSHGQALATDSDVIDINQSSDLYSSVKDVEKLQEQFKNFSNFYTSITFNKGSSIIDSSKTSNDSVFAIEYSANGKPKTTSSSSVNERMSHIIEHFSQDLNKSIDFQIDDELIKQNELDEQREREIEEKNSMEESEQAKESNEIITLRKRRDLSNIKKRKRDNDEKAKEIDFTKSVMEIETDDRRKDKRQKKKPSFDPYSKDALSDVNVPQLKKKKHVDRGKNVIFKKK